MRLSLTALALGALAAPNLAAAQDGKDVITAVDPQVVLRAAETIGIAELGESNNGDPEISGTTATVKYLVFFQNCDDENQNCGTLELISIWTYDGGLEAVNDYNTQSRFTSAYLDEDGDVIVSMDINTEYGITFNTLKDDFGIWQGAMTQVDDLLYTEE